MARTTSEDKFVFVSGVKQKGGLVGMTGDSISDAEALLKADVGLCMGSGCDVAKDNSDLVILDNNFISIQLIKQSILNKIENLSTKAILQPLLCQLNNLPVTKRPKEDIFKAGYLVELTQEQIVR